MGMSIHEMPAAREMDGLIAKKLFRWDGQRNSIGKTFAQNSVPYYSSDITAAWRIVTVMQGKLDFAINYIEWSDGEKRWRALFSPVGRCGWVDATAETAPLAICRAILKVL